MLIGRHAGEFVFSRMESQALNVAGAPVGPPGILTVPNSTAPLGQSAYDSTRDRFLTPWRHFDLNTSQAMFVSGAGLPLSAPFDLGLGASDYVSGPRAAYSPVSDSYVVVQANGAGNAVQGAIFSEVGVNKGLFTIDPAAGGFLARPNVIYAAGADAFVVGWLRGNTMAMLQVFDAEGFPITKAIKISERVTLFDELPALTFCENTLDGSILVTWTENAGDPGRSYTRVMSAVLRLE